ncbi:hypothetical protein M3Y96_00648900 [Aphelenchoides besseyi]|nr:hypothetical protein M3Y96_00648900 [Aphelenchoides besseyi]
MAASRQQSVDSVKKSEVRAVNNLSRSDPPGNQQRVTGKAFLPLEKRDESRPSTLLNSAFDKQIASHLGSSMDLTFG